MKQRPDSLPLSSKAGYLATEEDKPEGTKDMKVILAINNDGMELPAGLIEGPQDLMKLLKVSQATAYRILKAIQMDQGFTTHEYKFEIVEIDNED